MQIFDCFPFWRELDVLKLRLEILKPLNAIHVLVEAPISHTGDPKPLYFKENAQLFSEYNIRHIVTDLPNKGDAWENENKQRDAIIMGLYDANDEDLVIVSDLDEIPKPESILEFIPDKMVVAALKMNHYTYYLNCQQCIQCWEMARLTTFEYLKTTTPNRLRQDGFKTIMLNAGWHLSWMGGIDRIMDKFFSYAHTESCTSANTDRDALIEKLNTGESLWSNGNKNDLWPFVPIDDSFPKYIRDNEQQLIEKGLIKPL